MALTKEEQLLHTIVSKAWEDKDFKKELITNPIKAIEEITGQQINLPPGKRIVVHDQTDDTIIHINISAPINIENMELSEEQLEIIAGGGVLVDPILRASSLSLSGLV